MNVDNEKKQGSRELVRLHADRLLKAGEQPTQALIRERIFEATGIKVSPNLVSDEMRGWWADLGMKLAAERGRPGIPEAVIDLSVSLWDLALEAAHDTLKSDREAAQNSVIIAEGRARTAEANASALQHQLELTQKELQHIQEQLQSAQNRGVDLEQMNADLSRDSREMAATNAGLRRDMAAQEERHGAEVERLRQGHSDEMERSNVAHSEEVRRLGAGHEADMAAMRADMARQAEAWDGARKHLMLETDRLRDSMKVETERINKERDEARQMESQIRIQRAEALEQVATLKGKLEQLDKELRRAQDGLLQQAKDHARELASAHAPSTRGPADKGA
ncbi:DNA-binding protein [Cupriavidus sp. TMH.W2]|uniref:DNA-binding protein n=1 Tax=Cupriavidus sp. TMH.W2 TaxID=3434465 RepID=UPI003D780D92